MSIFLIVPWVAAAGLAYWKMETNASQIQKLDPNLSEELKNDKDGKKKEEAKKKIPGLKTEIKELEDKIVAANKTLENDANDDDAKNDKKTSEESLDKKQKELLVYESLDKNSYLPVLSFSNIAWVLGIFLGVGIIGHLITKQVLKMFNSKERD